MANIGATTAFYKVETSLTRANNEVSKSMERLATGKANANAGDRSSYVAMADTFRLDFVGTKAGIKGASVVMGYLETGMRVLDSASALLSRLQELAVLGANDTNTDADALAINAEAEAIADEFHRLMSTSTYKGKDIFVDTANSEYVSMGGRDAEMNFGIGKVEYSNLYLHDYEEYAEENGLTVADDADASIFAAKEHLRDKGLNSFPETGVDTGQAILIEGVDYELMAVYAAAGDADTDADILKFFQDGPANGADDMDAAGDVAADGTDGLRFTSTGSGQVAGTGQFAKQVGQLVYAASEGMYHNVNTAGTGPAAADAEGTPLTNLLTTQIESVQAKINTARVQAGSQYAALESAVNYTTDLTAQYELGYNTVNDVNFSMETAHLAKNQILQQAATAMLAQANQGQQGLLQLIS
jgi:flagellin